MLMIEIGEDEEVLYPDRVEEEELIPIVLPVPQPAEVPLFPGERELPFGTP